MQQNRYFRNLDWWLVIAIFGLVGIGICLIASATHSFAVTTGKAWHVERQSLFLAIDLALVIFSLRFDYRLLKDIATPLYVFNIILLLAVILYDDCTQSYPTRILSGSINLRGGARFLSGELDVRLFPRRADFPQPRPGTLAPDR